MQYIVLLNSVNHDQRYVVSIMRICTRDLNNEVRYLELLFENIDPVTKYSSKLLSYFQTVKYMLLTLTHQQHTELSE